MREGVGGAPRRPNLHKVGARPPGQRDPATHGTRHKRRRARKDTHRPHDWAPTGSVGPEGRAPRRRPSRTWNHKGGRSRRRERTVSGTGRSSGEEEWVGRKADRPRTGGREDKRSPCESSRKTSHKIGHRGGSSPRISIQSQVRRGRGGRWRVGGWGRRGPVATSWGDQETPRKGSGREFLRRTAKGDPSDNPPSTRSQVPLLYFPRRWVPPPGDRKAVSVNLTRVSHLVL